MTDEMRPWAKAVVLVFVPWVVWLNVTRPLGDAAMPPALSSYGPRPTVSPPVGASIAIAEDNQ